MTVVPEMSAGSDIERLLMAMRPKLHRYCARMTGSVIDGEDVLQEAIVKAIEALPRADSIGNPGGWLFRIAHNASLDFLRNRSRIEGVRSDKDPDMIIDPATFAEHQQFTSVSLRTFMRLPVAQRSCVILMDVLDYSLQEIANVTGITVPAVKASLHRGRAQLRSFANDPYDGRPSILSESQRLLLAAYVDRFNARDFDAVRDMLADEVRLELVARGRMKGRKEVVDYFGNYARHDDWRFAPGLVDSRPALIAYDPADPFRASTYFVLLDWAGENVAAIRDFRYARYVIDGAELRMLDNNGRTQ
jgi:RNA polymerase sigma-70 factor (ECF subfamily)